MKKIFLLIGIVLLFVSGCEAAPPGPRFEETSTEEYGYSYLIDQCSGVVYLEYHAGQDYGITVMLNADGTPVTASQLELDAMLQREDDRKRRRE